MEQEDYLLRHINQLGKVLAKVLAGLIGIKTEGRVDKGMETVSEELKNELDLDLDHLCSIPFQECIEVLIQDRHLNEDHLNMLAEIISLLAEEKPNGNKEAEKSLKFNQRALLIYEYLDQTSSTYSFDRKNRIELIKMSIKAKG